MKSEAGGDSLAHAARSSFLSEAYQANAAQIKTDFAEVGEKWSELLEKTLATHADFPAEDAENLKKVVADKAAAGTMTLDNFIVLVEAEARLVELSNRAKAKFTELDADASGHLAGAELEKVVSWMLEKETKLDAGDAAEIKADMLQRIDTNGDGALHFNEFVILYLEEQRRMSCISFAKSKFKELDTDNSGFLENKELDKVVESMLELEDPAGGVTKESLKTDMMAKIDANGDGKLSLDEFTKLCDVEVKTLEMKRRADAKFDELDTDKSGALEYGELDQVVTHMYKKTIMTAEDIATAKDKLLAAFDKDGDKKIDRVEFFIALMKTGGGLI